MKRFKLLLQRFLPDSEQLRTDKRLRFLGALLHDPQVWHFSRRSTIKGLAIGAFYAFFPMPWQMVLAAVTAAWLRFNLPVAVAMVWISNPLTMPPIFYGSYHLGAWLLNKPPLDAAFEPSLEWLWQRLGDIGWPVVLGSLAIGAIAGVMTFCVAHLLWRWHIVTRFRRRRRNAAYSA